MDNLGFDARTGNYASGTIPREHLFHPPISSEPLTSHHIFLAIVSRPLSTDNAPTEPGKTDATHPVLNMVWIYPYLPYAHSEPPDLSIFQDQTMVSTFISTELDYSEPGYFFPEYSPAPDRRLDPVNSPSVVGSCS